MDRGLVTSWIHQSPISTPPNTHRYLVPASLIGGSLWGVRNPDQCPHLHHWTPIDEVARVPATPTGRPRLPRHPSGGKWDKELAWRPRRNGHERGARAGRPRLPGVGSPGRRLRCRSPSPSRLGSVPLVSATSVTKFVGRKEADRVGSWRLRYVYLRQINSHRCALCVTRKHQLSRSSPRSLSVFVPTVSLWQLVRSSLHSVSLLELPFHGGFYPVSTPITTIRHRWSSFCTWPTYLPLSPESFSRCRLRWTTPPSPQRHSRKAVLCQIWSLSEFRRGLFMRTQVMCFWWKPLLPACVSLQTFSHHGGRRQSCCWGTQVENIGQGIPERLCHLHSQMVSLSSLPYVLV